MGGHYQAHAGSSWGQGNALAIIERARHPTFRMGTHLIRCMCKCLLDDLQIQETVVTTAGNHAEIGGQNIEERSSVAIETIETKQHGSRRKPQFGRIVSDHRNGPQQFATVIPIARSPKRTQELVSMCLEQDCAGAHDFSRLRP